ncbi:MAG: lipid IV(A) 3-deoxy-D-manno-octulosonic acid transferase [Burkholderiaceae bacterium]
MTRLAPIGTASRAAGERGRERFARRLYTAAWWLGLPFALGYLLWRARRQPDYLRRIGERLGRHPARKDRAPLIWLHAVSVGETRAAQPLVRALLDACPDHRLLLTHMTPTGLQTGAELFADLRASGRLSQAMLPWDYPFALRAFLDAWRPAVGLLMETELWPNLAAVCREREVPLVLVNARLSQRSLRKGQRWRWLMRPALAGLAAVFAQTEADAARIRSLGREVVEVPGNLKFDLAVPESLEALGHAWRRALLTAPGDAHRPAVLAASTRDGEEALLLDAWCAWRASLGRTIDPVRPPPGMRWPPLLVIVPRHPQRFDQVAAEIRHRGLALIRRSEWGSGLPPAQARGVDVVLGDSMGEMFAYYALADAAIIGGTLLPFGGQNLIEACAMSVPAVVGPHTFNFEAAAAQAIEEDAAVRVADATEALFEARSIVADPLRRESAGERGRTFAARHRGATARTVAALVPLLLPDPVSYAADWPDRPAGR